MAGLLAWAADVVGGGAGGHDDGDDSDSIPLIFTPEQLAYAQNLDRQASSLTRSIQDLQLRLPPSDLSQRLPHLHAHSLASSAALALQLNAHTSTKEQVQSREVRLQEENAEYEKAISDCENKMQERLQEVSMLQTRLEELDADEKNLKMELESLPPVDQSRVRSIEIAALHEAQEEEEAKSALISKLERKRQELASMEEIVQSLEKEWAKVQDDAAKKPSPAQREKILDKQLHSLIEQLEGKQAQAERLVSEIHSKELELARINGLSRSLESSISEGNISRNRYGRSGSTKDLAVSDYSDDPQAKPPSYGRMERLQRLMLLRSSCVVYILLLHIMVFIRLSFY